MNDNTTTAPADPWGTSAAPEPATGTDAWGNSTAISADDWLAAPASTDAATAEGGFQFSQLWDGSLPVERWINEALGWIVGHFRPFFQTVRAPIDTTLTSVEQLLLSVPLLAMITLMGLLAWQFAGRAIAVGTVISLLLVAMLGIWPEAMVTLSLVLTSLVFCIVIGLPLGILLASSDRTQRLMRPLLDAM